MPVILCSHISPRDRPVILQGKAKVCFLVYAGTVVYSNQTNETSVFWFAYLMSIPQYSSSVIFVQLFLYLGKTFIPAHFLKSYSIPLDKTHLKKHFQSVFNHMVCSILGKPQKKKGPVFFTQLLNGFYLKAEKKRSWLMMIIFVVDELLD